MASMRPLESQPAQAEHAPRRPQRFKRIGAIAVIVLAAWLASSWIIAGYWSMRLARTESADDTKAAVRSLILARTTAARFALSTFAKQSDLRAYDPIHNGFAFADPITSRMYVVLEGSRGTRGGYSVPQEPVKYVQVTVPESILECVTFAFRRADGDVHLAQFAFNMSVDSRVSSEEIAEWEKVGFWQKFRENNRPYWDKEKWDERTQREFADWMSSK